MSGFDYGSIEVIKMKSVLFELDEVIVKHKRTRRQTLSARKIVANAINNLSINLPQNPYSYVGYYRDYQFKDGAYTNLNEALLEVFDQGYQYQDYETSKIRILEYNRNHDFPIDTIAQGPYDYKNWTKTISKAVLDNYGGNEYTILRVHNPIRNYEINSFDFVNRLVNDFMNNHIFSKGRGCDCRRQDTLPYFI